MELNMINIEMLIIKDDIKDGIKSYNFNKHTQRIDVTFSNGKIYPYRYDSIRILKNPVELNLKNYKFTNICGRVLNNITKCLRFKDGDIVYYRMFYNNGTVTF